MWHLDGISECEVQQEINKSFVMAESIDGIHFANVIDPRYPMT